MTKISLIIVILTTILVNSIFASKVEQKYIFSKVMNKKIPAIFIIPDSYHDSSKSFPVVYLLHGFDGSYRNWVDLTSVEDLPDLYDIIIVCPDGDKDSWYFDSPIDSNSQYETNIAVEVVNFTDKNYRTVQSRNGRAIAGLSMGDVCEYKPEPDSISLTRPKVFYRFSYKYNLVHRNQTMPIPVSSVLLFC